MPSTVIEGEIERAEPHTELHCSPVLRSYAVTIRLPEGFLLCLAYGGQDGGQAGDSERRRGGAQHRPPPPLGLSKAHIPARQRKGRGTRYRGGSLIPMGRSEERR